MVYKVISSGDFWLCIKPLSYPLVDIYSVVASVVAEVKSVSTETARLNEVVGEHRPEPSALREAQGLQLRTRGLCPAEIGRSEGARPPEAQPERAQRPATPANSKATS